MPALHGRRRANKADIPTLNKIKYTEEVRPILENQRFNKEGMVNLNCQATHCVRPKSLITKDCDILYTIFALKISQDISFVWNWLHQFMMMHKKQFKLRASDYLKSKGLNIDMCDKVWMYEEIMMNDDNLEFIYLLLVY